MSVLEIPVVSDRFHYSTLLSLDGTFYRFVFRYNDHQTCWYMSILTDDEQPLVMGQRVTLNSDLLAAYRHLDIPQGRFTCIDTQGQDQEPTRENFGERVLLLYVEAA